MKKYFYLNSTNSFVSFTAEEIKEQSIKYEALVLFQKLIKWKQSGDVFEINKIFKFVSPTITKSNIYSKIWKIIIKINARLKHGW
ncbi:MAG: hypothetical protein LBP63_02730 [Prevotellaceae bacterium]|jgi:hypothetical protein|nr:hypothetical protein [Prevotellaceae bacterium]